MPEPAIESRAAFARRMEVSRATVTNWAHEGRIVCDVEGDVDVEASIARLRDSSGSMRGANREGIAGGAAVDGGPRKSWNGAGLPAQNPGAPPAGSLLAARTALAMAQAQRVEQQQAERAGLLVERARYAKAAADAWGPIFAEMSNFSAQHAPHVAAETDPRKVQNMLDDAMESFRRSIAATLRKMAAGPGPGDQ